MRRLLGGSCQLADPRLQRPQLLGVFVAGLVVGGNGSGNGRERNACGGRISISGGLGQLTGGGSVVRRRKRERRDKRAPIPDFDQPADQAGFFTATGA